MNSKLTALLFLASVLCAPAAIRAEGAARADFDEAPTPVKSVAPDYPSEMKRAGASGIVTIKVAIDENGDVAEQSVAKSSRPEFEASAMAAVAKWKFKPAKKGGVAVKSHVTIPIKFSAES